MPSLLLFNFLLRFLAIFFSLKFSLKLSKIPNIKNSYAK